MSIAIDATKCNEYVVDKYIAHYGLKVKGGLNAKVNAIERHTLEKVEPKDHSTPCTKCGGTSDFNLPECPYCGDSATDDVPTLEASSMREKLIDKLITEQEAEPAAAAAASSPEPVTEVVEQAVKPRQGMKKVDRTKKANGHAEPAAPTPAEAQPGELAPADALDRAVASVKQALHAGASSYWDMGVALIEIYDKQLWKQRLAGGRQAYTSFTVFCRDELGMSHAHAYPAMDVARGFTRELFLEIGSRKLQLLLRLPRDRQLQLAEEARAGRLPKARLQQIVQEEAPGTAGVRDTGRKRSGGTAAQASAAAAKARAERKLQKPADGALTAVYQQGRARLKLWARPSKKQQGKPVRAVSVTQDPWVEEQLVNGAVARYTVVKGKGGLELVREIRRAD